MRGVLPSWIVHGKEDKNEFILVHVLRKEGVRVGALWLSECCVPGFTEIIPQ